MKKPTTIDEIIADLNAKGMLTEEEIIKYMTEAVEKGLLHSPNFEQPYVSSKDVALEYVIKAMREEDLDKVEDLLAEALSHDPDSIEAYELMGYQYELPFFATVWFEKAIRIGEKRFGKMYRRYRKGSLWQYPETHAYLRSLNRNAECLWAMGSTKEAIRTYQELLVLDPDDHQCCRWKMVAHMMQSFDYVNLNKAFQKFGDDNSAFAIYLKWLERITFRDKKEAQNLFTEAISRNPYVPKSIVANEDSYYVYDDYQPGTIEEAQYIASFTRQICEREHTAMSILRKHVRNNKPGGTTLRRVQ